MARRSTAALLSAALLAGAAALVLMAPAPAAAAEAPEWGIYRSNLKSMQAAGVKGGTVGDALGTFLDYQFDLPLEFMRRAMVRFLFPLVCCPPPLPPSPLLASLQAPRCFAPAPSTSAATFALHVRRDREGAAADCSEPCRSALLLPFAAAALVVKQRALGSRCDCFFPPLHPQLPAHLNQLTNPTQPSTPNPNTTQHNPTNNSRTSARARACAA